MTALPGTDAQRELHPALVSAAFVPLALTSQKNHTMNAIKEIEAERSLVLDAAHLKAHHPISYADAFAAALAARESAVVLTGDPEFEAVQDLVEVGWLGR